MIQAPLSLVTAPTEEPVTLEQAKAHCKIEHDEEDALIEAYIAAARAQVESFTRRQLVEATWDAKLPGFPTCIAFELPKPPLRSVTFIKYFDTAGVEQTWSSADYIVTALAGEQADPGSIELAYAKAYPAAQPRQAAVTIRFVAGYGDHDDVPKALRQAILLYVTELHLHRAPATVGSNVVPNVLSAEALMWPYRVAG